MEPMLDAPTAKKLGVPDAGDTEQPPKRSPWWQSLQATSTRRGLLLTALGGLLIAGLITALPGGADGTSALTAGAKALGSRGNDTFGHVKSGDCLNWPARTPDAAQIVACKDEHRFEVAEAIDMSTFPGSEYGPDAAPPSTARIQQITQEQCQAAARQYLGPKYDPDSRFVVSLLWSGERQWKEAGERRMMCGLQLPGPNGQQLSHKGKVADVDQSKVWSAGTCLGIDPATNQPTDIPVDCSTPHAIEVTGSVNLGEKFPDAMPADPDQDAYVKDTCTKMADAYLAPTQLRATTLTLMYSTISLPSWAAGSHQVSCNIGATLGNGGWSTLLNSAKGPLLINGQPVVPPPAIPPERLNMPPIPMPSVDTSSQSQIDLSEQGSQGQQSQQPTGNQHLPGQSPAAQNNQNNQTTGTTGTGGANATSTAPAPQGNTFINGPPAAPGVPQDGPPPGDGPPLDGPPPAPGAPPPAVGPPAGPAEPAPAPGGPPPGPVLPPGQ
jgi:predicted heme/steroid binding protein